MKNPTLLMKTDLVIKTLSAVKTQTRRIAAPQPGIGWSRLTVELGEHGFAFCAGGHLNIGACDGCEHVKPRFMPGDIVAIKENFWRHGRWLRNGWGERKVNTGGFKRFQKWKFKPDAAHLGLNERIMFDDKPPTGNKVGRGTGWHRRPSIFMPVAMARCRIKINSVRLERLNDMRAGDAEAEGCAGSIDCRDNLADFKELWDSINDKREGGTFAWSRNPFVFVYSFEVAK